MSAIDQDDEGMISATAAVELNDSEESNVRMDKDSDDANQEKEEGDTNLVVDETEEKDGTNKKKVRHKLHLWPLPFVVEVPTMNVGTSYRSMHI